MLKCLRNVYSFRHNTRTWQSTDTGRTDRRTPHDAIAALRHSVARKNCHETFGIGGQWLWDNTVRFSVKIGPLAQDQSVNQQAARVWCRHLTNVNKARVAIMHNLLEFWFLSASLYFSKRGAYWDRLCRDVVGCHARALWPNGAS